MSRFDVVGFGALNVDKLFRVNRIAAAEEESFITNFAESCGGSAANAAVGLARLGCMVGFVGKVADDREGKMLVEEFRRESVDTVGIAVAKQGRSGTVMGFVDERGERALYIDSGVNDEVEFGEDNRRYAFQAVFLHLTSFVGGKPFEAQKRLLGALSDKHPRVRISFDPGEIYVRKGLGALRPIIKRSFIVLLNENEIKLLTGENYETGSKTLIDEAVKIVAVKLGERGCYVTNGKKSHLIKAYKVDVVDTTGAGDAFCAGFLYGLIKNKDLYECGKLGNFVAARCIEKTGAREALPRLSDLIHIAT